MKPTEVAGLVRFVVLDTNAVLDWLVFANAEMRPLADAIEGGGVRWLATPRMRGELERVLAYTALQQWNPDCERTLTAFDRHATICAEPTGSGFCPLICTDPDDQVFIDLAITHRATWLVTRDRALLKLRRRAAHSGVQIVTPPLWRAWTAAP
jgi:uncharacterized protein